MLCRSLGNKVNIIYNFSLFYKKINLIKKIKQKF